MDQFDYISCGKHKPGFVLCCRRISSNTVGSALGHYYHHEILFMVNGRWHYSHHEILLMANGRKRMRFMLKREDVQESR